MNQMVKTSNKSEPSPPKEVPIIRKIFGFTRVDAYIPGLPNDASTPVTSSKF